MKFNNLLKRKATTPDTHNFAGGEAFAQSLELELVTLMLTSFHPSASNY